eukprot:TRINITY_DN1456_c0_g1_i1.p2 TRINITY_DN1456_c0_g1~~TRINITY_DN1456_c0_g1_i1.p2  ORF type:complete len:1100 (-),score=236.86 TRINITY_DN1456_c0_g1_i1:656-3955(-)
MLQRQLGKVEDRTQAAFQEIQIHIVKLQDILREREISHNPRMEQDITERIEGRFKELNTRLLDAIQQTQDKIREDSKRMFEEMKDMRAFRNSLEDLVAEKEIKIKECTLSSISKETKAIADRIELLEALISDTHKELSEGILSVRQLQEEFKLEQTNEDLVCELKEVKSEIEQLKRQCEELSKEKEEIGRRLEEVTENAKKSQEELVLIIGRKVNEAMAEKEAEELKWKELVQSIMAKVNSLEKKSMEDDKRIKTVNEQLENVMQENRGLKEEMDGLRGKLSEHDSLIASTTHRYEELAHNVAETDSKYNGLDTQVSQNKEMLLDHSEQLIQTNTSLNEKCEAISARLYEKASELARNTEAIKLELLNRIDGTKVEYDQRLAKTDEELIKTKQEFLDSLNKREEQVKLELTTATEKKIEPLEQQQAAMQEVQSNTEQSINSLGIELNKIKAVMDDLQVKQRVPRESLHTFEPLTVANPMLLVEKAKNGRETSAATHPSYNKAVPVPTNDANTDKEEMVVDKATPDKVEIEVVKEEIVTTEKAVIEQNEIQEEIVNNEGENEVKVEDEQVENNEKVSEQVQEKAVNFEHDYYYEAADKQENYYEPEEKAYNEEEEVVEKEESENHKTEIQEETDEVKEDNQELADQQENCAEAEKEEETGKIEIKREENEHLPDPLPADVKQNDEVVKPESFDPFAEVKPESGYVVAEYAQKPISEENMDVPENADEGAKNQENALESEEKPVDHLTEENDELKQEDDIEAKEEEVNELVTNEEITPVVQQTTENNLAEIPPEAYPEFDFEDDDIEPKKVESFDNGEKIGEVEEKKDTNVISDQTENLTKQITSRLTNRLEIIDEEENNEEYVSQTIPQQVAAETPNKEMYAESVSNPGCSFQETPTKDMRVSKSVKELDNKLVPSEANFLHTASLQDLKQIQPAPEEDNDAIYEHLEERIEDSPLHTEDFEPEKAQSARVPSNVYNDVAIRQATDPGNTGDYDGNDKLNEVIEEQLDEADMNFLEGLPDADDIPQAEGKNREEVNFLEGDLEDFSVGDPGSDERRGEEIQRPEAPFKEEDEFDNEWLAQLYKSNQSIIMHVQRKYKPSI